HSHGQRLQLGALQLQAHVRHFTCGGMNTRVRHALQPRSDMGVRGGHIELETGLLQSRCERHQEARLEVAVEALDLAFSLGSVRPAQPWPKAKLLSYGQKIPMEAMLA